MLNNVNDCWLKDLLLSASLYNFTLNPTPPILPEFLHICSVLQTYQALTRLGVLSLTVPLTGNALLSHLGMASSFLFSCLSLNVITSCLS